MRMPFFLQISVFISAFVTSSWLYAGPSPEEKIRSNLKQHFPELTIDEISKSPVNDLYQVTAGSSVLYVTSDGRYAVSGDLIDLENAQTNLTENTRKAARLKGLKNLGEENMIIFSPKDPKYTVTVFTDVDCGYCRKLQSDMAKLNDLGIAIRYLAFPRTGPNSPTYEKMLKIWCAKDKKQALSSASQDKPLIGTECTNNNVAKEFQFGLMVGVTGTPTMIFEDGTLFPGYLPPEKLLEVVEHIHSQKKS